MEKYLKNELKILKFIRNNDGLKKKDILNKLNITAKSDGVFHHLKNQGLITLIRDVGRVGPLMMDVDPVGITTNGIKYLENRIPNFIKSYLSLFISSAALIISIIAITTLP